MAQQQQLRPWGRFKLVSKDPAEESDHLYFYRNEHRIGRNRSRADIILDKLFISSVHCVVTLEDTDDDAEADESEERLQYVVKILDLSRNAVYVNEERVGKSKTAVVRANDTIHFTKPGLNTKSISPTVYRFEIFEDGFSPENNRLRNTTASSENTLNTQPVATPAVLAAPAANVRPTQALAHASPSVTIAPTQDMASTQKDRKRSVDDTHENMDVNFTANMSTAGDGERALSVSSASGSGSSAKRQRREVEGTSDAADLDTTARIQHANHDLRRRLQESKSRELVLSKNLSEAEIEILSLTNKMEECQEHGKKLQDELYCKDAEADEREQLIAQLKQEKISLEANLAASAQVLRAANDRIKVQEEAVEAYEKEKIKLETHLTMVTAQLNSVLSKNSTLSAQVKALEVKTRELQNAKLSVLSGREMVEEGKREVQEEKDMIGDSLAEALQVFHEIHKQLLRAQKIKTTPVIVDFLASRRRRRQSEDSASTEQSSSLGDARNLTDSSLIISENSQPTPVNSSDVNTQDPDESETLDQDAALADAPLPTLDPFQTGTRQALLKDRPSQDADDESEIQQMPSVAAADGNAHDTLDQQHGDSEESAVSVRSASKTPPAKPFRTSVTPVHSQQQEEEQEEESEDDAARILVADAAAASDAAEELEQEEKEADADEKDKAAADQETTKAKEKEEDDEDEDEDFVIIEQPPTAATMKSAEDQSDDKKPDDSERDTTSAEQKQEMDDDEDDKVEDDDEDEPPVPTSSTTERWLPITSHDESLDSQANASAGIFDDETQLSQ